LYGLDIANGLKFPGGCNHFFSFGEGQPSHPEGGGSHQDPHHHAHHGGRLFDSHLLVARTYPLFQGILRLAEEP
jgi:hypothetical protein